MWKLLRRILYSLALVVSVVLCNFLLIHLAPGDAVDVFVGQMGGADATIVDKLRATYGLANRCLNNWSSMLGKSSTATSATRCSSMRL